MDATTYKHCSFLLSALFVLNSLAKASPPGLWLFNSDTKLHWLYSKMIRFGKCYGGAVAKKAGVQKMLSLWRKYRSFCRYFSRCHAMVLWFCGSACIEPLRHFCVSVILNAKAPPNFALSNLWTSFSLPWKSQHREKSQLFFLLPGKDEWFIVLKTFSGEKHLKTNTYSTFSKSVNSDQPKKSGFNMNQCTCPIRPHKRPYNSQNLEKLSGKARLKSKDYNGGFVFTKKHLWSFM